MITAIVILGIFIGLWIGLYKITDDNTISFVVSFWGVAFGTIIYLAIQSTKETNHCLETVQPIIPRIVHLEDSSKKILKYDFEGEEHVIEIDRTNNNFYVPESLLKIEPCNRTIVSSPFKRNVHGKIRFILFTITKIQNILCC